MGLKLLIFAKNILLHTFILIINEVSENSCSILAHFCSILTQVSRPDFGLHTWFTSVNAQKLPIFCSCLNCDFFDLYD